MENTIKFNKKVALSVVVFSFPLTLEYVCQNKPSGIYCNAVKPFIEFPEPLKAEPFAINNHISSVTTSAASATFPYLVGGTTTTTL